VLAGAGSSGTFSWTVFGLWLQAVLFRLFLRPQGPGSAAAWCPAGNWDSTTCHHTSTLFAVLLHCQQHLCSGCHVYYSVLAGCRQQQGWSLATRKPPRRLSLILPGTWLCCCMVSAGTSCWTDLNVLAWSHCVDGVFTVPCSGISCEVWHQWQPGSPGATKACLDEAGVACQAKVASLAGRWAAGRTRRGSTSSWHLLLSTSATCCSSPARQTGRRSIMLLSWPAAATNWTCC
jgi:hypothetical protein